MTKDKITVWKNLPVLPLRDVVIFPHMVMPLFVGRKKSMRSLELAVEHENCVVAIAQKDPTVDDPTQDDLYSVGTLVKVIQLIKLPDETIKILVEAEHRVKVTSWYYGEDRIAVKAESVASIPVDPRELKAFSKAVLEQFEEYVELYKKIPAEILSSLMSMEDPERLSDSLMAQLPLPLERKQEVLEEFDLVKRLERIAVLLAGEVSVLKLERDVRSRVRDQVERAQRKYFLENQREAVENELRVLGEIHSEVDEFEQKIEKTRMPREAKEKAIAELNKLRMTPPMSAEATVSSNYLRELLGMPWEKATKLKHSIAEAQVILDKKHDGLEEVKKRFIEYLVVMQRVKKIKGPILCLVGPPGVGKTSLAQSIAEATGRKFVRIALGGVRDEAEIRGHRRTYIGAMPGRLIQKISKAGVKNPVILLDEIDKMSSDFRGDPAAALLEALDPEQNYRFNDHYLEVDYDLSQVVFLCTANSLNIPAPLMDRMEIIRISGYTEDEKVSICMNHLIQKQKEAHGLKEGELELPKETVIDIIRYYTREAGVRGLERACAKICRRVLKKITTDQPSLPVQVKPEDLEELLGVRKYRYGLAEESDRVGLVSGLAWTEVGGELLTIEAAVVPGKAKMTYTGQLGEVMQESIQAALTVVRSRARALGIRHDFYEKSDIHVHVPEGATPKDGPSAGIGMCTALVSALTHIPVRADVAMTGEITLRGEVLPIGGLKEKLLAASRAGIKHVLIPEENKRDLKEIPENILQHIEIHAVRWIDEVLALALQHQPIPLPEEPEVTVPHALVGKPSEEAGKEAH